MENAIEASGLIKEFGDFTAVDGISFNIRYGETFAILGENGAGKSTTMRMISGRSPLTAGKLFVHRLDVRQQARQIRSVLGIVPQENNLDPDLNVRQNLLVYARYFRMDQTQAARRCDELLDFVGLTKKLDANVESLSGGMKRRLIIARALLHNPLILLLDEPTTGLDPSVRQEIWEKLEELRRTENLTIVLSTHYMDEAEKLCQRLFVMDQGKIVLRGNPQTIIREKAKKFALEVRETNQTHLKRSVPHVISQKRGKTHLYFAESTDELTPIMDLYSSDKMILRPSNLEDVFLLSVTKD